MSAAAGASGQWPFFYPNPLHALRAGPQLVCVQGGRGLGRTTFLLELQHLASAGMVGTPEGGFLSGRRPRQCVELLPKLVADPRIRMLCIDDLDALLGRDDRAVEDALLDAIFNLPAERRLAVSISLLPDEALSRSRVWSDWIMPLQPRTELNPWAVAWDPFLRRAAAAAWGERYGHTEVAVWGRTLRLDDELVALWTRVVVDLTGGHPTLVGPAVDALRALVEAPGDDEPAGAQLSEQLPLEELLRRYLSGVLTQRGLPAVRRRVGALRTSNLPVERQAHAWLVALAGGAALPWFDEYHLVIQVIRRDGLAYQTDDGEWHIPGRLVRAELLSGAAPGEAAPAPPPRPAAEAPLRVLAGAKGGTLLITTAAGHETLVLSGLSWEIFRRLHDAGGESVALKTLIEQLERSESALRSAIRRLQQTLREAGHGDLVRNTRGGYALRLPS